MVIKFEIAEGYLGQCVNHFERVAKHEHFVKWDPPLITDVEGFPPVIGVTEYVCDECHEKLGTGHE